MNRLPPYLLQLPFLLALLLLGACSREEGSEGHLEKAEKAFTEGTYNEARIHFLNVLQTDTENEAALTRLGKIWMDRGSALQALPYLLAAKEVAPGNNDSRAQLAIAFYLLGYPADALAEAETILDREPGHSDAVRLLCQLAQSPAEIENASKRLAPLADSAPSTFHLCTATLALQAKDLAKAEEELRKALSADASNYLAHLGAARISSFHKNEEEAVRHFEAAEPHLPRYSPVRTAYAEYLVQQGDFAAARERLDSITKETPDFLPAQRLLAQILTHEKKHDEALKVIDEILNVDPTHLDTLILQSQLLRARGRGEEALAHLRTALEIEFYKTNALLLLNLAQTQLVLEDKPGALATLKKTTSSGGAAPEAHLLLARLELQAGNATSAQTALQPLFLASPDLPPALVIQGEIHRQRGELPQSAAVFEKLVALDEDDNASRLRLASVYQAQNKTGAARRQYQRVLEKVPGNFFALRQLIELDLAARDFAAGHGRVDGILRGTPGMQEAHFLKARIFHAEKNWPAALAALDRCPDLELTNEEVSILRASCHFEAGNPELGRAELEKITSRFSDRPRPLLAAALNYEELGEYDRARELHERVLELAPETVASLNNLAVLLTDRFQDLAKARELAEKARALAPGDPAILDTLGWIRYQQGDYAPALTLLQKSAPDLKGNPEAQRHLGLAAYQMVRPALAMPALREVSRSDSPHAESMARPLALLADFQSPEATHDAAELGEILADSPRDIIALLLLARVQTAAGQPAEAAQTLLRGVALNDQLAEPHQALAALYLDPLDDPARALDHAQKARALAPDDPGASVLLGRCLFRKGDFEQAHALLREGHGKVPADAAHFHDLAWTTYYMDRPLEAASLMREALTLSPSPEIERSAGQFLSVLDIAPEHPAPARDKVEEILASNPHHIPALLARARFTSQTGERAKAEEALRTILAKAPGFLPARKELAALLVAEGKRLAEAREIATKARDSDPKDPRLARTLAKISYLQKDYPYAIQLFEESARAESLDSRSLLQLGLAYRETGAHAKAVETLTKALAQKLPDEEAEVAREAIKELK